jgi:hypothetical protein
MCIYYLPNITAVFKRKKDALNSIAAEAKARLIIPETDELINIVAKSYERYNQFKEVVDKRLCTEIKAIERLKGRSKDEEAPAILKTIKSRVKNYLVLHNCYLAIMHDKKYSILNLNVAEYFSLLTEYKILQSICNEIIPKYKLEDLGNVKLPTNPVIEQIEEDIKDLEYKQICVCLRLSLNIQINIDKLRTKLLFERMKLNFKPIHYMYLALKDNNNIFHCSFSMLYGIAEFYLQNQLNENRKAKEEFRKKVKENKRKDLQVIGYLKNNPNCKIVKISEALGYHRNTISPIVKKFYAQN